MEYPALGTEEWESCPSPNPPFDSEAKMMRSTEYTQSQLMLQSILGTSLPKTYALALSNFWEMIAQYSKYQEGGGNNA